MLFRSSDFYKTDVRQEKENLNILVEEIDFSDMGAITGFCLKDMHKDCAKYVCNCNCHKGEK